MDHLAVADVHAHVADRAVEEHQVTGLQLVTRETARPICDWLLLEWGRLTPAAEYAYCVRPEQSNASGPPAPQTYGSPTWASAVSTAFCAAPLGATTPLGTAWVSPPWAASTCCCCGAVSAAYWRW